MTIIVRSKASLGSSREVVQDCGVSFANCLCLVPLIIGQNFCTTCAKPNQTGPVLLPAYIRNRKKKKKKGSYLNSESLCLYFVLAPTCFNRYKS